MIFGEFQWVELIYGFFGSFVGFLLAILTDNYFKKQEERGKIKTVLEAVESELKSTAMLLDSEDGESEQLMFFSTFVWESITASDFFSTLLHEEKEKCSLLIQIYTGLDTIRSVQEKFPDLVSETDGIRCQVLVGIGEFCALMESGKKEKRGDK